MGIEQHSNGEQHPTEVRWGIGYDQQEFLSRDKLPLDIVGDVLDPLRKHHKARNLGRVSFVANLKDIKRKKEDALFDDEEDTKEQTQE
jgi:hypothetical protein